MLLCWQALAADVTGKIQEAEISQRLVSKVCTLGWSEWVYEPTAIREEVDDSFGVSVSLQLQDPELRQKVRDTTATG